MSTGHLDALRWRAGIGFRCITVLARLTLQVKGYLTPVEFQRKTCLNFAKLWPK